MHLDVFSEIVHLTYQYLCHLNSILSFDNSKSPDKKKANIAKIIDDACRDICGPILIYKLIHQYVYMYECVYSNLHSGLNSFCQRPASSHHRILAWPDRPN